MKKYLFIIATAAIVASCTDNDSLKKDIQNGNDEAITFESFTSKQTRAENTSAAYSSDFFNHHETFQVWGFKNTNEDAVFTGDIVTVTSNGAATPVYTYKYSPLRFWDKAASMYEFYAAAPSGTNGGWDFKRNNLVAAEITDPQKQDKGYFETSSTLAGTNITTTSGDDKYDYQASFKDAQGDVDKLIAARKDVSKVGYTASQTVQFDFIHILSRLNVTIKKDSKLDGTTIANSDAKANVQKVTLKDLRVVNLKEAGSFYENRTLDVTGTYTRWDASNESGRTTPFIYHSTANVSVNPATTYEVTSIAAYILQSLVIPQTAAYASVALDGNAHSEVPAGEYANVTEWNYDHEPDITAEEFNNLSNKTKPGTPATVAINKNEDALTDAPYIKIVYEIKQMTDAEGTDVSGSSTAETFTAYFNLAAAFGLDGVDHSSETNGVDQRKLAFNEGWQNTLNITINPTTIDFCAKVAEWVTYENDLTVY